MAQADAVILTARRTAIGKAGGLFRSRSAPRLAAPVLRAALDDCGLTDTEIDRVILGNALAGGNVARAAALEAGLPPDCPATTVDMQCASGLEAIVQACALVRTGLARLVLAGGVESSSTAPWRLERPSGPTALPRIVSQAPFAAEGAEDPSMIEGAEAVARVCGIGRARQDAYAARSHARALAAQEAGRYDYEMTPVVDPAGEHDEGPRDSLTPERLARLPPLLPDGTVTVGNACGVNDGAAVVVVAEIGLARALGATGGLRLVDAVAGGVDPALPGLGAVPAGRTLMQRQGLDAAHLDQIEFNEAFAAQTLACLDRLGLPEEAVCPGGGALALGHPYGASGAILVTRLFHDLMTAPERRGLALLSAAGGLGLAALFETVAL